MNKKMVLALACGAVVTFATGAIASPKIQAVLFPSTIKVHKYMGANEIGQTDGEVINYNKRVYVPLRTFAQAMDATISYEPPTKNKLPRIDIYSNQQDDPIQLSEKELKYSDPDNYVSIGYLESSGVTPDILDRGVIKFHKDLKNKRILITSLNKDGGTTIYNSHYVYIHQENSSPPKAGDIRSFRTNLMMNESTASYQISVIDNSMKWSWPDFDTNQNGGSPMAFDFSLDSRELEHKGESSLYPMIPADVPKDSYVNQYAGQIRQGNIFTMSMVAIHTASNPAKYESFPIELVVSRVHADRSETEVYRKKITTISGLWKPFDANTPREIKWDMMGKNGKPLAVGTYSIYCKIPNTVNYTIEGQTKKQSFQPFVRFYNYIVQIV
ncbi:hypothetical protein ACFO9Q_03350 [Paenibacillus sp. GCM10023252]|uniref:hypothetical protein n=1 Tax=Paenibacillus sp. GCM10023252 TaxID=3252649 RepID=UPI0036190605